MIKSVLQSYPIYTLASTVVPKLILRKVEGLMAQFLWNVKGETRTYWINWRNLCYPELEGVLGFRSVDQIQDALQAKLMWLALSGDSLRANFIRMKCFVHDQPRIQINSSPLWRPPVFSL